MRYVRKVATARRLSRYLEVAEVPRLNLGCGANVLDGWFNTDLEPMRGAHYLDAAHDFPFPDQCFSYIFSEHMIEHLAFPRALNMLRECFRVLVRGGTLRIATPDLVVACSLVADHRDPSADEYTRWSISEFVPWAPAPLPAFAVNQIFRGFGHLFLFDATTLGAVLRDVGFADIRRPPYGQSTDEHLRNIEGHGDLVSARKHIEFETLIIEATRPAAA